MHGENACAGNRFKSTDVENSHTKQSHTSHVDMPGVFPAAPWCTRIVCVKGFATCRSSAVLHGVHDARGRTLEFRHGFMFETRAERPGSPANGIGSNTGCISSALCLL
eukprot:jgi/Ulvmu1/8430/UM043_0008.1